MKRIHLALLTQACLALGGFNAHASEACLKSALKDLGPALSASIRGPLLTPAKSFEGVSKSEADALALSGKAATSFIATVETEMAAAARAFVKTNDAKDAAQGVFGNPRQRQRLQILRRGPQPESIPSSSKEVCKNGGCTDLAINVRQLYVANTDAKTIVERFSIFKFETVRGFDVYFCEQGPGCQSRSDLLSPKPPVVQQTEDPKPADIDQAYLLREVIKGAPQGSIDSTSVVRFKPLGNCDGKAFLLSAVQLGSENTFEDASLNALILEVSGQTLVYGSFQGRSSYGRGKLAKIFNGFASGLAINALGAAYNAQARALKSNEQISKDGLVK